MKKFPLMLFLLFSALCACSMNRPDWPAKLKLAEAEAQEYRMTFSEEHFNKALNLYDEIISQSPDYRNYALASKAILMRNAYKFKDALDLLEQIPDTAAVFLPYSSKSIFTNLTLTEKYELECDFETSKMYLEKANEELGLLLDSRKAHIYSAICSPVPSGGYYEDEDIAPFLYYLQYMLQYDHVRVKDVIIAWEDGVPCPNEHSEFFFNGIKEMFGVK